MMSCRKNTWVMPPARSATCVGYLLNFVNRLLGHFCEIQNVLTIFGLPYKLGSNVPYIMFMLDVQLSANASFHVLSAATRSFFTHSLAGDDVETWSGFWTISAAHMQAASSVWSPWTLLLTPYMETLVALRRARSGFTPSAKDGCWRS